MNILERLKTETHCLHKALENELQIMKPEFQLSGYRRLVARFYGFYMPAEKGIATVPRLHSALTDWPKRRKMEWLVKDLNALGFTPQEVADLPLCRHLPALPGTAEALGCLYVLEGSTLGGRIIGRHLRVTLQLEADNGASFFRSYGEQTGAMWRAFQGALLSIVPEEYNRTVNAAAETFECMQVWLKDKGAGEKAA
jgi:heme oxygenase